MSRPKPAPKIIPGLAPVYGGRRGLREAQRAAAKVLGLPLAAVKEMPPKAMDEAVAAKRLAALPPEGREALAGPKRGRPRKPGCVAAVAAKVWDDVTGGAGAVLVDGQQVPVPRKRGRPRKVQP